MIDIRKLKELVRLMVSNDLTELDLRDNEEQVTLRRPSMHAPPQVVTDHAPPAQVNSTPAHQDGAAVATVASNAATASQAPPTMVDDAADETGLHRIESPMVGTFYPAPNPDSPPFVQVGDKVTPDTVVCIVEAMKIFNEIKAECSGTIERVLANNAQSVEFGQPLFLVKPD